MFFQKMMITRKLNRKNQEALVKECNYLRNKKLKNRRKNNKNNKNKHKRKNKIQVIKK